MLFNNNLYLRASLIFVFLFYSFSIFSQDKEKKNSEFDIYFYKPEPRDRIILEVNHNGWLNSSNSVRGKLTSGGVNFYLYFDYPIKKSKFSFAWGAGLSSYNIHGKFNVKYRIDSLKNEIVFADLVARSEPYTKNRLGLKIIEIPIEFRFRTHSNYQLKIMAGFKTGIVLQSFRKIYDADGKRKMYDVFGINQIRYGTHLRIGIEQIHLTFFYAMNTLFKDGQGTSGITPYSIGLGWTPKISLGGGNSRQQF